MKANAQADRFAKAGAQCHAVPEQQAAEYMGLVCLVQEAARWAVTQEAWLQSMEYKDCQSITDPPLARQEGLAGRIADEDSEEVDVASKLRADNVGSHALIAANVWGQPGQKVIACKACGAVAFKRKGKLIDPCKGRPATKHMRTQRDKLLGGQYRGVGQQLEFA